MFSSLQNFCYAHYFLMLIYIKSFFFFFRFTVTHRLCVTKEGINVDNFFCTFQNIRKVQTLGTKVLSQPNFERSENFSGFLITLKTSHYISEWCTESKEAGEKISTGRFLPTINK